MIIGVTGSYAAGKDTAAEYFVKKGFAHISLSDVIREELAIRKQEITRENLINVGNDLRERFGAAILAEKALQKVDGKNFVISSIRNPAEVHALSQRKDFVLVNIDAPAKLRFERLKKRNLNGDIKDYKEFLAKERAEKSEDATKQQLHKVMAMAKVTITNTDGLGTLHSKLDLFLNNWTKKLRPQRPSWDDYFMEVANAISKRATCDRGRSGCVIAKDKQLLVTGYVGSPRGMAHCDDVGHQFKKVVHEDGKITEHCVRTVHAEQNAICQAAKLGIPIEGATLYCRMTPCRVCAMLLINCGIKRVVCERKYQTAQESEQMFRRAGIELVYKFNELQKY